MHNHIASVPKPQNEKVFAYAPGDAETGLLKKALADLSSERFEIAPIINGAEVRTGKTVSIHPPHAIAQTLGVYHEAQKEQVGQAIQGALKVAADWARTPANERAAVFLRAAELLSKKYRYRLNAATMLGQSKTCHQAEIDSACELIDFLRFNPYFQDQLYSIQPESPPGLWNRLEYRPLEGFVFAVTPFNFTAIAGNLPTSAALMGNVVLWKPASTAVYSGYFIMKLLEEAGLPPGVIQFLPGSGGQVGDPVLESPHLAGVHFTGSTRVFHSMWKTIGAQIAQYKSYPRIVGETGGKDFVFVHPSASTSVVVAALLRGAFEYQGQKCSAASRAYIPRSLWPSIRDAMVEEMKTIRMGDVADFSHFMGAVIDKKAFETIREYIETAKKTSDCKVLAGGECRNEQGYFIEPTLIETTDPKSRTMSEEIFGPVLTVYVYPDNAFEATLKLCDETSPYALTGSILSQDRAAIARATEVLCQSAGNFYINNKPTGAVVGQQPFGGARGSGTNDKAGSLYNLARWTSLRTLSETFDPPTDYRYPFLGR
jgi:1-pyrroline-5-carboxylate dehydrogenase